MKKYKDTPFYFQDCHICNVVGQADDDGSSLSHDELTQAFHEQEKINQRKQAEQASRETYLFKTQFLLKKKIVREIEVLSSMTLYQLAEVILTAYHFDCDHCFGFYSTIDERDHRSERSYELFVDLGEQFEPSSAQGVRDTGLTEVWVKPKDQMMFLFDYGDDWRFIVTLKSIDTQKAGIVYPRVVKSVGEAPAQYPLEEDE